jgi:hypothetical protein
MKIISQLKFDDQQFVPSELYVDTKHLVVIGNTVRYLPGLFPSASNLPIGIPLEKGILSPLPIKIFAISQNVLSPTI